MSNLLSRLQLVSCLVLPRVLCIFTRSVATEKFRFWLRFEEKNRGKTVEREGEGWELGRDGFRHPSFHNRTATLDVWFSTSTK